MMMLNLSEIVGQKVQIKSGKEKGQYGWITSGNMCSETVRITLESGTIVKYHINQIQLVK